MPLSLFARHAEPPLVEVCTKGLEGHLHPELVFVVREDLVPPQAVYWLAAALTEEVERGERTWRGGDRYVVGWSELRFVPEDDVLVLHEETPTGHQRGVWRLLHALGRMNDGLEGLSSVAPRYPHQRQLATVAGPLEQPLLAVRGEPSGNHSGWHFNSRRVATVVERPLHELAVELPALLELLALPPGTRVGLAEDQLSDLRLPGAS